MNFKMIYPLTIGILLSVSVCAQNYSSKTLDECLAHTPFKMPAIAGHLLKILSIILKIMAQYQMGKPSILKLLLWQLVSVH